MAGTLWFSDAATVSPFSEKHQNLYRAYSHSYVTEANNRHIAFFVDLAFTAIAASTGIMRVNNLAGPFLDLLTTWSPVAALIWLLIRSTDLLGDDKEHRRIAVTVQEQFDLTFWKPDRWHEQWNDLLCEQPIQPRIINELANNYKGEPIPDDYWVDTTGVPPNDAALLRIQQTAGWGAKSHSRYARLNKTTVIISGILVIGALALTNLHTRDTAVVLMTVAPFLIGRLQSSQAHTSLARRRATLERHIQKLLSNSTFTTERDVRAAQDELFRLRRENRRIPAFLYNRYAARDREAIDTAVNRDAKLRRSKCQAGRNPQSTSSS